MFISVAVTEPKRDPLFDTWYFLEFERVGPFQRTYKPKNEKNNNCIRLLYKKIESTRSTRTMVQPEMEKEKSFNEGGERRISQGVDDDVKTSTGMREEEAVLVGCKRYSLVLGAVIGCFIQLSCMGAFFVYSKLAQGHHYSIWAFSLMWSAFTSLIGLGIMIILSVLFRRVSSNENVLLHLELYVSSGAVIGVCFTWLVKNICMGVPDLVWQSLLSITLTICYIVVAKQLVYYSAQDDDTIETNDLAKPLLENRTVSSTIDLWKTRRLGYTLGSFIGCFVQTSSLAAHHLFLQYRDVLIQASGLGNFALVLICLSWDIVICCLGVAALLLVRKLTLRLRVHTPTDEENRHLFMFEACFCTGALFGVNVCWMATDMILGLHDLLYKTVVTLTMSLLIYLWNQRAETSEASHENHEV